MFGLARHVLKKKHATAENCLQVRLLQMLVLLRLISDISPVFIINLLFSSQSTRRVLRVRARNAIAPRNILFGLDNWRSIWNRGRPWNCRMAISHCFAQASSFPGCPPNNTFSCIFCSRRELHPRQHQGLSFVFIRSGSTPVFGP